MTQYTVEMNINEILLVDAEDKEDAEAIAVSQAMEGYDIEDNQIEVLLIKEVK